MVEFSSSVNPLRRDLLFDPQTSGGLLICLDRDEAVNLVDELHQKGIVESAVIGEVISAPPERILVN
jgi:selenide,water dikinase